MVYLRPRSTSSSRYTCGAQRVWKRWYQLALETLTKTGVCILEYYHGAVRRLPLDDGPVHLRRGNSRTDDPNTIRSRWPIGASPNRSSVFLAVADSTVYFNLHPKEAPFILPVLRINGKCTTGGRAMARSEQLRRGGQRTATEILTAQGLDCNFVLHFSPF